MIRLTCGQCGKALKVPDQLAGKRGKCPSCGNTIEVPQAEPQPEIQPDPIADFSYQTAAESSEPLAGPDPSALDALSQHLDSAAPQEAVAAPTDSDRCPKCNQLIRQGAVICVNCGHNMKLGVNAKTVARTKGAAGAAGKTLIAIGASCVGAIIGGVIWALIAKAGFEFGIVAWGVGLLAGAGVVLFTNERNLMIGLAAVGMAVFGLLLGKFLIVQWYSLDQSEIREALNDTEFMQYLAESDLAHQGKLPDHLAKAVMDEMTLTLSDNDQKELSAKVNAHLKSMNKGQKEDLVREEFGEFISNMSISDRIMATSSFYDLIWFGLAIVSAWGMGTKEVGAG